MGKMSRAVPKKRKKMKRQNSRKPEILKAGVGFIWTGGSKPIHTSRALGLRGEAPDAETLDALSVLQMSYCAL